MSERFHQRFSRMEKYDLAHKDVEKKTTLLQSLRFEFFHIEQTLLGLIALVSKSETHKSKKLSKEKIISSDFECEESDTEWTFEGRALMVTLLEITRPPPPAACRRLLPLRCTPPTGKVDARFVLGRYKIIFLKWNETFKIEDDTGEIRGEEMDLTPRPFLCWFMICAPQDLVVLVHDMCANWELTSDAISKILDSQIIFLRITRIQNDSKNHMGPMHNVCNTKSIGDGLWVIQITSLDAEKVEKDLEEVVQVPKASMKVVRRRSKKQEDEKEKKLVGDSCYDFNYCNRKNHSQKNVEGRAMVLLIRVYSCKFVSCSCLIRVVHELKFVSCSCLPNSCRVNSYLTRIHDTVTRIARSRLAHLLTKSCKLKFDRYSIANEKSKGI
ncbi:hypothetical protein LXL04_029470 [Taraxacum kok-saghyz]